MGNRYCGRAENASRLARPAPIVGAMNIARFLFRLPLVLSAVCIAGAATATWADQDSLWTYNDSVMYLVSKGQVREFHYQEPRPALGPFGVTPGTLAFRGVSRDGE